MTKINVVGTNPNNGNIRKNFDIGPDYVYFELEGPNKNIETEISSFLDGGLSAKERDLLSIGVAVYLADLAIPKNSFTYGRTVNLLVPVRDSDFWESHSQSISRICRFLDRNNFSVFFYQSGSQTDNEPSGADLEAEAVCCLSGGLDSLAGAHKMLKAGKDIVFSTVAHNSMISRSAKAAHEALCAEHGESKREIFNATPRYVSEKHSLIRKENTMSCRSFLYLAVAATLANHIGAREIIIPENGILALNIPINAGRYGTRTAHPIFLDMFSELLNDVFTDPIQITNPLNHKTKTEVVSLLSDISDVISDSVSCAHATNAPRIAGKLKRKKAHHCGYCYPCIVRRVSIVAAGMAVHDSEYVVDIFNDLFPPISKRKEYRDASIGVLELLAFYRDIDNMTDSEIREKYPEFENLTDEYEVQDALSMYKRFATDVKKSFSDTASDGMKKAIQAYLS